MTTIDTNECIHLEHLTVTTGHARISPRDEVADNVVSIVADQMVWSARAPDLFEIHLGGYEVKGAVTETGYRYMIHAHGIAVAECDLVIDGHAAKLLATLVDALRFMPSEMMMQVMPQVGDLERCIAWTLIEHPPGARKRH